MIETLKKLAEPDNRAALPLFITGAAIGVANYYVRPAVVEMYAKIGSLLNGGNHGR